MYCPHCGEPGQEHRFCSHCGGALRTSPESGPSARHEVNITVNVGPPVLMDGPPAPTAGLMRTVRQALNDRATQRRELERLREEAHVKLRLCHDLISDIESTYALDLLPSGSPLRDRYLHGLEARREAAEILERATSPAEISASDAILAQALHELRATRYALSDGSHSS